MTGVKKCINLVHQKTGGLALLAYMPMQSLSVRRVSLSSLSSLLVLTSSVHSCLSNSFEDTNLIFHVFVSTHAHTHTHTHAHTAWKVGFAMSHL